MKFKMNDREWEIIELDERGIENEYGKEADDVGACFGLTDYSKQKIFIWKDLHDNQKRQTLMHELIHCYIACYCSFEDMIWNEDIICNISANSHDIIHKIVEDYFK